MTNDSTETTDFAPYERALKVAASGVGLAILVGLAVVAATALAVSALRVGFLPAAPVRETPPVAQVDVESFPATLLILGTLAGILGAACAAWLALRPIASPYRRGGLAAVSAFATALVMLLCVPVYGLLGQPGLLALVVLAVAGAAVLVRRLRAFGVSA
jgi:hypothetical protein